MKEFLVVYLVKHSELWCADECSWVEESMVCSAVSKRGAQRAFREDMKGKRVIIGRHIDTRLLQNKNDTLRLEPTIRE